MSDEVKFPLTKKVKSQFSVDYEKIFLKKPVHNITDEKLVEIVNANRDKITPNAKTNEQPSQEGIQDEEIKASETGAIDNGSDEPADGTEGNSEGELMKSDSALKSKEDTEREFQFDQYKQLNGEEADGELSTGEVTAANISKMNYNAAVKVYFDLFGKRPLEEMTTDQITSVIANEEGRIEAAIKEAASKNSPAVKEFDYNPEFEMLIVNKKDKSDKRVINKLTFEFLKGEFDAVSEIPKELLNKK